MSEKPPRAYAAEIIKLRTKAERREALENVPDKFRDWVKDLVTMEFERLTDRSWAS